MTVKPAVARAAAVSTHAQSDNEAELEEVDNYGELRAVLSKSSTPDAYCRSALYFALTGRAHTKENKIWIARYHHNHLVLLLHPNVPKTLLAFCPFVSSASQLAEHIDALSKCKKLSTHFQGHDIFFARILKPIAEEFFLKHAASLPHWNPEPIQEKILDWVYPSYDVDVEKLLSREGRKLKIYRKKIRKFIDQDIDILRPRDFLPHALIKVVREVNKGWVRAKQAKHRATEAPSNTPEPSPRNLMGCYRAMARLNGDPSLAMDGLILKRGKEYLGFSFWERPKKGATVACFAALPVSYEKGLSEFLYHIIAKCLKADGYSAMCIGGSETASLDQFKKKLDPSGVYELQTIRVSPRVSELCADSLSAQTSEFSHSE